MEIGICFFDAPAVGYLVCVGGSTSAGIVYHEKDGQNVKVIRCTNSYVNNSMEKVMKLTCTDHI